MTFQDRMRISPSNLEMMVRIEQQHRNIIDKYLTEHVVIFYPTFFEVIGKHGLTRQKLNQHIIFTIPDFMTSNCITATPLSLTQKNHSYWLFYLDGPPHLTLHNSSRDARINHQIEKWNFNYKRWSYKRPTKHLMNKIVDEMEALTND